MNRFTKAVPIFLKGKNKEINFQAGFQCVFQGDAEEEYLLRLAGSTLYRVYLNGEVMHYGPARGPHGYVRCDAVPLFPKAGRNILSIEVAGYNCPSFYTMDIPSFLQAELYVNGSSIAYTGRDFKAIRLDGVREQKTLRYSYQRAFTEIWHCEHADWNWKTTEISGEAAEEVHIEREYLDRGFELPQMELYRNVCLIQSGKVRWKGPFTGPQKRFTVRSENVTAFSEDELACDIMSEVHFDYLPDEGRKDGRKGWLLGERDYAVYRLGRIAAGFIRARLRVKEAATVYLVFAEKLTDGKIECGLNKDDSLNIIKYTLKPDSEPVQTESFECYSTRYIGIICTSGCVEVEAVDMREYAYPVQPVKNPLPERPLLTGILEAACQSFRQNTIDAFMDCPGRERGGFLCDSYFTAMASMLFTGTVTCEEKFLDNFRLAKEFPYLPSGMLPCNYPGENPGKEGIPQWVLWFLLQLEQYGIRGGDVQPFRALVTKILDFIKKYENADGLLERLPYWNFVEWSKANEWVNDVNYPTNMLYARALLGAAHMYEQPELAAKAEKLRETIREQSYDGRYFRDHAVRDEDGVLRVQSDRSAICQHEAAFFEIIDIEAPEYTELRRLIVEDCGFAEDDRCGCIQEGIVPLGAFIGYAIRGLLLTKMGLYEQNLCEIERLYGRMAEATGTLWEHTNSDNSLNHGFGSYVACVILECAGGIENKKNMENIS